MADHPDRPRCRRRLLRDVPLEHSQVPAVHARPRGLHAAGRLGRRYPVPGAARSAGARRQGQYLADRSLHHAASPDAERRPARRCEKLAPSGGGRRHSAGRRPCAGRVRHLFGPDPGRDRQADAAGRAPGPVPRAAAGADDPAGGSRRSDFRAKARGQGRGLYSRKGRAGRAGARKNHSFVPDQARARHRDAGRARSAASYRDQYVPDERRRLHGARQGGRRGHAGAAAHPVSPAHAQSACQVAGDADGHHQFGYRPLLALRAVQGG